MELKTIIYIVIGFFTILLIVITVYKFYKRKREKEQLERDKELISSVTSLNRGTNSELYLILQLLKRGTPTITIFHDLIIKKENGEFSQIDLVLVTSEGVIVDGFMEVEIIQIGRRFYPMVGKSINSTILSNKTTTTS